MKAKDWWTRGYVRCLVEAEQYFANLKDDAWRDFEDAEESIRQYKLGFYQGVLAAYEQLKESRERSEKKANALDAATLQR